MGLNQGYNRIMNGFTKLITKSERERGYLFITHDKRALKLLRPKITLVIDGVLVTKNIDSYGRVSLGKDILNSFSKEVSIIHKNKKVEIKNIV